ncbi:S-adenosyl-L-methionine-dependent methyltransferase [Xylariaceae sp. AK1471]|nr:S-adenosyl-L-methionine-dependent methyltransferase [Xylariaceae sp. AK1471]
MFTVRYHGRALYSRLFLVNRRCLSSTCHRSAASTSPVTIKTLDNAVLQAHGPVAEQLASTGVWDSRRKSRRLKTPTPKTHPPGKPSMPHSDKSRINIVSDKLCDDILSYIGPSLERHRGCDILDIYPGAGVWSSKLHQYLQPRSHLLMEPDAELYRPLLQPLLDQPGTTLIPKSGIIWRELNSILTPEYLPHQVVPDKKGLDRRNDTLLVTANVAFHPKKRFLTFESMTSLILHQFVDAIRTSNLFHRYGQVRMLIWTRCDDKQSFLPKSLQRRKKQALENDLLCEWVHEVCGNESLLTRWFAREDAINTCSMLATVKRMQAKNLQFPSGREPEGFQEALAAVQANGRVLIPGKHPPTFKRPYQDLLAGLRIADAEQHGFDKDSENHKTLNVYKWRENTDLKKAQRLVRLSEGLDTIVALRKAGQKTAEEMAAIELEWETGIRETPKSLMDEFVTYKDNLHCFRQTPPVLEWDRRHYEPMEVQAEEFFPNIHCSLMDIQPKKPHPLLRQTGPQSNRAADLFDVLVSSLMHHATHPIGPSLDGLWPGASDYILPRWTSVQDMSRGGFPLNLRYAEPVPRLLNARQWEQLLELWMEWPFRPEFHELLGRTHDDLNDKFDDSLSNDT